MIKLFDQYILLTLILLISFAVRLYKIDSPIADWHSWRQADTAAVTRNFIKYGFNPFVTYYDDMSGVAENPVANPNSFRFVEFPIYNITTYPVYLLFGVQDKYSRLVSVLFSLGSIVFLYLITRRYLGKKIGLLTSLIYGLLPFNVFFSRTTLPEPTFLFFALGMVYFVDSWILKSKLNLAILAFIFTVIAFLIKPWAIFFVPPLIYSLFSQKGVKKSLKYLGFFILALLPFFAWRLWILQQPEGIPASGWLLNGDGIRFRPAFWRWIISERLGGEMIGATGLVLFVIGMIIKPKSKSLFLHIWLLSQFLYLIIIATGNVRHDYYQYIVTPIVCVFLTLGFTYLISGVRDFIPRFWTIILSLIFLPLVFYSTWLQVKEFYNVNNTAMVSAGKKADKILPKDAIVVAPYNGDTAFLYQINRKGWAFIPTSVTNLIADYGVQYFISTAKDNKTNWVMRHFQVIEDNPQFVIVDLTTIKTPILSDLEP
jgi:4-amino-4-deoxy-L-arabinose transferase-like glycosyltransferase